MTFLAPVIFGLVVAPVLIDSYEGQWCGQDSGEVMRLDGTSRIGFNTTVLCTADSAVDLNGGASWSGDLLCKNVTAEDPTGDGNFILFEEPLPDVSIRIDVLPSDQLVVTPHGRAAETYDFCG